VSHCSFCKRGSRAVVFGGDAPTECRACGACTLAIARWVVAASDEDVGELWRIEPAPPASEVGHEVRTILSDVRAGLGSRVAADDTDTHFDLALAYREMGLYDAALQELYLARHGASDARLAEIEAAGAVTLRDADRTIDAVRAAAQFIASRERLDEVVLDVLFGGLTAAHVDALRGAVFAD
jgi:hypothetical protein